MMNSTLRFRLAVPFLALSLTSTGFAADEKSDSSGPVSYYEQIRPIFQASCQGCHQPAKAKGDYVMTQFQQLLKGGKTGDAAITPGKAEESSVVLRVKPEAGEDIMPPKGEKLNESEIALIERWISEGAKDDTPQNAVARYSLENPPSYVQAPIITSMDFSPDGKLLAVAGFHEVILLKADGSGQVARLIGLSEQIDTVKFSPDGTKIAVTGGLPERMGELQVWDVAKRELDLSLPMGFDTIYGASWSPDGKLVAFGMPDNTMRAVNSETGEQVVFMGGHNDWVLDTEFNKAGTHIISVGRDMSTKLTEVATQRLVDNLTSITPEALKGGIGAVVIHPSQDHILIGGSDGAPQIYRTKRETVRKIGDNANLIRKYPQMRGRIWSVAFRPDGKQFVAGSSLNGQGEIAIYKSEYDPAIPADVKKAMETARSRPDSKKGKEQQLVDAWQTKGVEEPIRIPVEVAIYAVAYSPDGKMIAASGQDGLIRLINPADGKIAKNVTPVEITAEKIAVDKFGEKDKADEITWQTEPVLSGEITKLDVSPKKITISGPARYQQLLVTAHYASGEQLDVTRMVAFEVSGELVEISKRGLAKPKRDGTGKLTVALGAKKVEIAVEVAGLAEPLHPYWITDINPVISRMGCNAGTCHGAKDGKAGFKLSLRGYDPVYDVRAFTDDIQSRRVNYASPDDSLMLLKTTGAVPHEGGQLAPQHSTYYDLVRSWISDGGQLELAAPRVKSIEVFPKNPVIQKIGSRQQFRVVATLTNGEIRDVTREAFVESGNADVSTHDNQAMLATIRRGEAPILARYEGAYAATTLTVMGDRKGFEWSEQPANNRIDELVASKWQRMKIEPSGLCDDSEFIRRVYLDLTGLPPSVDVVRAFLADKSPMQKKRDGLVDSLIGTGEFVDHWANKWADLLQVNSKFLGGSGASEFRAWIHEEVKANTPYDEFVYKIITATGSNKDNPPASYYKILREPDAIMENTTHLFLATRFNCNKCHDHPFERWNVGQYYETASFFTQIGLARDAKNAPTQNLGGSAVENAKPLYEVISDTTEGAITNVVTGEEAKPVFPYPSKLAQVAFTNPEAPTRREQFGAWLTSGDNDYFAMSYANRIWGYLLGTGIIEPIDDIRAGNPPTNPELLQYLTSEFVGSDFNSQHLMRLICKSRAYQLSIQTNRWNEDDQINFAHAKARRLPAEVLFDAVFSVTGSQSKIPGAPAGARAASLADAKIDLKSGFLANLGRPARESACECERSNDVQMGAIMAFVSGPTIAEAVGQPGNAIEKLVAAQPDDAKVVEELYLRTLSRSAKPEEIQTALGARDEIRADHEKLLKIVAEREAWWVPVKAEREEARVKRIGAAAGEIQAYVPEYTKKKNEAEAAQKARITAADKGLKDYQAGLPKIVADGTAGIQVSDLWTQWTGLVPKTVVSSNAAIKLEAQEGGALLVTSPHVKANVDYTLTFDIPAKQTVTGFKIDALPNNSLAGFGPGVNPNGNFVVTEVEVQTSTAKEPKKLVKAKFVDAKTEHIQDGFNVKGLFNGNPNNDKSWAIAGKERQPHAARLKLEKPLVLEQGGQLVIKIYNRYGGGDYPLGHFRISATTSARPLEIGLPTEVAQAAATAPEGRTETVNAVLAAYFKANDLELLKRDQLLVKEQRPLPRDPRMIELEAGLKVAETPIKQDPPLLQLRQDAEYSVKQLENSRLTAAQDLAWALINNPSFLFNR
ncbi:MAG: WD40 repeat protein/mono/diheme cytochrome c family protein [Verrucomicrobiales bacterium]|jgi:WD40 repeat protein/mono/diheme cytochrome c family protein